MATTRARLRDVADLAGVSEKTVSNFVNGYPYMTPQTRAKVQAALTELNYRPNLSARSLSSNRTGFIALVLPALTNPHFAELAGHMIDAAAGAQWTVLIEQTAWRSSDALDTMQPLVDGVILHPESMSVEALARRAADTPIVLIVERSFEGVKADKVHADNTRAAYELTRHLIETGRTRIAALGLSPDSPLPSSRLRYRGFAQALEEAGLPVDVRRVLPVIEPSGRAEGAAAVPVLLDLAERPDAVVCFTDLLATGLLGGLHEAGISVPRDMAVAGFDGIEEGAFSVPSLTTVAWDLRAIADAAVRLLADRQNDPATPARVEHIGHTLIVRGSTTP